MHLDCGHAIVLQGYFELQPWGPTDLRRSWEVLSTLIDRFRCQVTYFEGNLKEIVIDRPLVALSLIEGELIYNDKNIQMKIETTTLHQEI